MGDHGIPDSGGFGDPGVGRVGRSQGPQPATCRSVSAAWAVTGIAGALLALASLPGVALAGGTEHWGEAGAGPTLSVLAFDGRGRRVAWFGARKPAPRVVAV